MAAPTGYYPHMELYPRDRRTLDRVLEQLRVALANQLESVSLYGDICRPGYHRRRTPLSLLIVAREVTPALLESLRPLVARWRRRRVSVPLVMDRVYIESSLDVFPIEFLELADEHQLVWGEHDPLVDIDINRDHLRLELESHSRGRMLHLWEGFLGTGRSGRLLDELLFESTAEMEVVFRGMLYLSEVARPDEPVELVGEVERVFELELPTLRTLEVARSSGKVTRRERTSLAVGALEEVRAVVRAVDTL